MEQGLGASGRGVVAQYYASPMSDAPAPRPGATSDNPVPVRTASRMVRQWIGRLGQLWIEGQITQMRERQATVWLTLRDPDVDLSVPVMTTASTARASSLEEGHRVVAQVKLNYFDRNGSLTWRATQFRAVGLGALMQQLDQLRRTLTQEGLFRDEHKRDLPFLPRRVGLICGRNSAARRDVEVNARRQWPSTQFEVREVSVQGPAAVPEVVSAVVELDSIVDIDVIVVTRGGGSVEDLLPFSNESLLRAVFAARTPIVSAIGHEEDNPLLDLVADLRASTPTAAGKAIVPDLLAETAFLGEAVSRARTLVADQLKRERLTLANLTGRPVMAGPRQILAGQSELVLDLRGRSLRALRSRVERERELLDGALHAALRRDAPHRLQMLRHQLTADLARLNALSPQATLDRGYAVVRDDAGALITDSHVVSPGLALDIRVARGNFSVTVADSREER